MSANANVKTIEAVLRIASRLIAVLDRETQLLQAMQPRAVAELQPEKEKLVEAYEEQVRALLAIPDAVRNVAPVLRAEFEAVALRFEAAMGENRRALAATAEAQHRLLNAIIKAAEEQRSSYRAYSAEGSIPVPRAGARSRPEPLSLSLNRQL